MVLVKDKELHRNDWSFGRVTEAIESEDGRVRKARGSSEREPRKLYFVLSANLSHFYQLQASNDARIAYSWARSAKLLLVLYFVLLS